MLQCKKVACGAAFVLVPCGKAELPLRHRCLKLGTPRALEGIDWGVGGRVPTFASEPV